MLFSKSQIIGEITRSKEEEKKCFESSEKRQSYMGNSMGMNDPYRWPHADSLAVNDN